MNDQAIAENDRAVTGNNAEKFMAIPTAKDAYEVLSDWLGNTPVIQTLDQAKQGHARLDATNIALAGMETERDSRVRPLNETVKTINGGYKEIREPLERLLDVLKGRINVYIEAERAKREAIAAEAARVALEAEQRARELEDAERQAIDNAADGEFTDVGSATANADAAFNDAQRASRAAAVAERDTNVRIGGGFSGRSLGQRKQETILVADAAKALKAILKASNNVLPEKIADAFITTARNVRKVTGKLPDGFSSTTEKSV